MGHFDKIADWPILRANAEAVFFVYFTASVATTP